MSTQDPRQTPTSGPQQPQAQGRQDAYRPFVSRRGRAMAFTMAAITAVVFFVVAFIFVPSGGNTGWTMLDKMALFIFGLAISWLLTRWGLVKAVPSERGLEIRNLFAKRFVAWTQIVNVQFGGGVAWCTLELDDTEHLAIMAIQRADGPSSEQEAARLAALVQHHNSLALRAD